MELLFSVDVEDWFHILDLPSVPDIGRWTTLPSRVERNFRTLLELFARKGTRVTCFFLGWVAERYPQLVKEALRGGHEVASHGYGHQLVYSMSEAEFFDDIKRAKEIIEAAAGQPVLGYRCPGFSVTEATPWFFDRVVAAGYRYDSSLFPAPRGHAGMAGAQIAPHTIETRSGPLVEFPISVTRVFGRPICFFGGGYLRLFPYSVVKEMGRKVLRETRPIVFYVHPREIDLQHPRLPMPPIRWFKSYVGLSTTKEKIERILDDFSVTTFAEFMTHHALGRVSTTGGLS